MKSADLVWCTNPGHPHLGIVFETRPEGMVDVDFRWGGGGLLRCPQADFEMIEEGWNTKWLQARKDNAPEYALPDNALPLLAKGRNAYLVRAESRRASDRKRRKDQAAERRNHIAGFQPGDRVTGHFTPHAGTVTADRHKNFVSMIGVRWDTSDFGFVAAHNLTKEDK